MNKLLELQKALKPIKKELTNPYFKSKYADINILLEMVKPELNKLGLVVVQPIRMVEGKNVLFTEIREEEKVLVDSAMILPESIKPQDMGSAITYYRRYSLQSLLCLEAADDDANAASGNMAPSRPNVAVKPKSEATKPFQNIEYASESDKTRGDEATKRSISTIAQSLAKKDGIEITDAQSLANWIGSALGLDLEPGNYGAILTGLKKLHDRKK